VLKEGRMHRNIFEKLSGELFFVYTLILQPIWAYVAARWLTQRWAIRKRPLRGWLIGLATLAGVFWAGYVGLYLLQRLIHQWYSDCPMCDDYSGLSYLVHYGSGLLSLIIFLVTAILGSRQNRPVA
jgi:hypothetical protein